MTNHLVIAILSSGGLRSAGGSADVGRVNGLIAALAFVVAGMYAVIAFAILPQLARAESGEPGRSRGLGLLSLARWGAMAFFAGCAITHIGIGAEALHTAIDPGPAGGMAGMIGMTDLSSESTTRTLIEHVFPHIAQIIGGGLFIGIAWSHLEWTVVSKEVAEGLRARETQFRSAFERAPVGLALVSVREADQGRILQISPALSALVGRSESELRASSYQELFDRPDGDRPDDLTRLRAGEPVGEREDRLVHRDGRTIRIGVEASVVRDQLGSPMFAVVQVRDVSQAHRSALLRAVPHAVARVLAEAPSVGTGMGEVVRELSRALGWSGGEYWQVDPKREVVHRLTSWWSDPVVAAALTEPGEPTCERGAGLPGAVWAAGSRIWLGDLSSAPGAFTRAEAARRAGQNAAIGLPIHSGEHTGVLVLVAEQMAEPDRELSDVLDAVGAHIGRFIERRRAEEFRLLVEAAPDAVVIADPAGTIRLVNAQTERLFGYPREELLGAAVEKLVAEQFRAAHPGHREHYFEAPEVRSMGTGAELYGQRRDGSQFPIEISLSPLEADGELLVSSAIRDLSDRRQAEELRFRLAAIVDSSDDAIIGCTLDGRITSWNRAAEEIFGHREPEAVGRSMSILLAPGQQSELDGMIDQLRRGERVEHHDAVRRRSDGQAVQVSSSMSAIRDQQGRLTGVSLVIRDVSQRKAAEAALAAAKDAAEAARDAFEAFSYSVAHDLRAPLRAIDGFSQILTEDYADVLDPTGQEYLGRVRGSAQKMADLINSLLELARVSHRELTSSEVDLSALAGRAVEARRHEHPERDVEVAIQPGLVTRGDATLLADALDNLIGNAWKFTRHRSGARVEFGQDAAGYFVRDNGAGFDMAFSSKLFGVFERLHGQHEFEGTGIGLATVQRIVRRHGGRIWAEGVPGEGACFHFTLVERYGEPEPARTGAQAAPAQ